MFNKKLGIFLLILIMILTSCGVFLEQPKVKIKVENMPNKMFIESKAKLNVSLEKEKLKPEFAEKFNFKSTNPSVVSVDDKGILTANKEGKAEIIVSLESKTRKAKEYKASIIVPSDDQKDGNIASLRISTDKKDKIIIEANPKEDIYIL